MFSKKTLTTLEYEIGPLVILAITELFDIGIVNQNDWSFNPLGTIISGTIIILWGFLISTIKDNVVE